MREYCNSVYIYLDREPSGGAFYVCALDKNQQYSPQKKYK